MSDQKVNVGALIISIGFPLKGSFMGYYKGYYKDLV